MILPDMYHWSPTSRRDQILFEGLKLGQPNVIATQPLNHVCLAPSASAAWSLSAGSITTNISEWDLWQVRLVTGDSIAIRPEFDHIVREVMVENPISPDRIWYVGSRTI